MNDMKNERNFSFGKVEFGVVPDIDSGNTTAPVTHENLVNTALCNKMDAVDALDSLAHTLTSNLSKAQYVIIRNSLEEMADLIRQYEGKPIPSKKRNFYHKNGNRNTKKQNYHKGGNKHD